MAMSLLCPIDFRYGRPKMKGLFEEESRLQRLLDVEAALARAEAKVGLIPEEAAAEIARKATTKRITVKRDRKSTRLNSSHTVISYAVFCLKKKNKNKRITKHQK